MDPHKYSQLIFDTRAKVIKQSKESVFNSWCWATRTSTCRKINLDTDLIPFTNIN